MDSENESSASETKPAKETIDFKGLRRVDHILASLQQKVKCLNTGTIVFSDVVFLPLDKRVTDLSNSS